MGTYLLNRIQLECVCERIGLLNKIAIKVAEEVFEKLNLNNNDTISYNDFIELIQSDTTTSTSITTTTIATTTTNDIDNNDIDPINNFNHNHNNNLINTSNNNLNRNLITTKLDLSNNCCIMSTMTTTRKISSSIDDLTGTIENNFNNNLKDASIDDLHVKGSFFCLFCFVSYFALFFLFYSQFFLFLFNTMKLIYVKCTSCLLYAFGINF